MRSAAALAPMAIAFSVRLAAQSYDDLTLVRNRPSPYASVLQVRAGLLGSLAQSKDPTIGLKNQLGWDGSVYYHQDHLAERDAVLDLYAGRDGAYFGVHENGKGSQGTESRLELTARYFPFYREGFYRSGKFVPSGRYEGNDWGAFLSFGRELSEGLRVELGPFYRRFSFKRNDDTANNFVVPDDYNAYGGRAIIEHNTLELDRLTGWPRQGFILSVAVEREQNDSSASFGTTGIFESTLPSGVWRGRAHMEWYFPQSEGATWEVRADGSLSDSLDRVYNYDAQKPLGHLWVDGQVGLQFGLGHALALTPYVEAQFVRILDEGGGSSDQETFFGGGADLRFDLGSELSLLGSYSYLNNESRPPVSTAKDTFGEHRFFVGLEARFGSQRR